MKEAAYKGMVRPILEYGSSVWDPHTGKLQEELEFRKGSKSCGKVCRHVYSYASCIFSTLLGTKLRTTNHNYKTTPTRCSDFSTSFDPF